MDRLPVVTALLAATVLATASCSRDQAQQQPPPSRFDAVRLTTAPPNPGKWCDDYSATGGAPFSLPKIVSARIGEKPPSLNTGRPMWINIWATWCGPCRREMPLIARWCEVMRKEGVNVDLWFVSIDEKEQDLTRFLTEHPEYATDTSVRLATFKDFEPWLKRFAKEPSTTIPIHILVGTDGKVRCMRAGALRDGDYPLVKGILASP